MAIDMERIRRYNAELKGYKEKSSKLTTELEISQRELKRICDELTEMLGTQVTPENIQAVYQQLTERIESTLASGEEILARIKADEAANNPVNQADSGMGAPQVQQATAGFPGFTPPVQAQPSTDGVFGTLGSGIPPMFSKS